MNESGWLRRPADFHFKLAVVALGLLTVVVFGRSLGFDGLSFDTPQYLDDHAIRHFDAEHLGRIFTSFHFLNYSPLTRLSFAIDRLVWGNTVGGFHGTSILLHWLTAVLVFRFFQELTQKNGVAWLMALAFMVHPTRVESVVWLASRKDVLAGAFGFAALILYRRARGLDGGIAVRPYAWCIAAYLCALASKPQWVPLCVVFIVLDLYERKPVTRKSALFYTPFFLLSALFGWLTVQAQFFGGARKGQPSSGSKQAMLWEHVAGPLCDLAFYVRKVFLPTDLSPRYRETEVTLGLALLGLFLLAVGAWWVYRSWRSDRAVFFGFAWFLLFLLPMLNLVAVGLVRADRFLYVAMLGLVFPLAKLAADRPLLVGTALVVLGAWFAGTWRYLPVWKDDLTLWQWAYARDPENEFAISFRMSTLVQVKDYDEAARVYQSGIEKKHTFVLLFIAAAKLAEATGGDPTVPLNATNKRNGNQPEPYALLGDFALKKGNLTEAEHLYATAFARQPTDALRFSLARIYEDTGQFDKGVAIATEAVTVDPLSENGWLALGRLYEKKGDLRTAAIAYERALYLDPTFPDPYFRLAVLAYNRQDLVEAERRINQLLAAAPRDALPPPVLNLLAGVRLGKGDPAGAAGALKEALQQGEDAQYRLNLARVTVMLGGDPRPDLIRVLRQSPQLRTQLATDQTLSSFLPPDPPAVPLR